MILAYVLIGIAVVLVLWIIFSYNSLVTLKVEAENAWAQIDVQLKRRFDLIPNLVESVKGYMKHEKELLENVTKARAAIMSATTVGKKAEANNMLSSTLKSLFAVAENYPKLQANENFLALQEELTGTENKIAYSRQHYNDTIMMFNTKLALFPTNMIAGMFNFGKKDFFTAPEEEKKNVQVKF
jgi:LemA protein